MSRIDYSKWDHIGSSDEDEDKDESTGGGSNRPRVTRLDAPSRITRTAEGSIVVEPQQNPPTSTTAANRTTEQALTTLDSNHATTTSRSGISTAAVATTPSTSHPCPAWTENGGRETTPTGAILYWSQDRTTVTLRLTLPLADVKAKQISVQVPGMLPYRDRYLAIGTDSIHHVYLKVFLRDDLFLEGTFPHAVHATEEADDADQSIYSIDWCLDRVLGSCYLVLTLCKAVPMQGVVVWWKRPLTMFSEIDLPQRNAQQSQQLQSAWDEAHRQFRTKMQKKKERRQEQDQQSGEGE